MTATKLPPRRTSPLTAADAFTRICDLRDGREARRRYAATVFDAAESEAENAIAERVPEEQRARLRVMLAAMPEAEKMAKELVAGRDVPAMTADEIDDAIEGDDEPQAGSDTDPRFITHATVHGDDPNSQPAAITTIVEGGHVPKGAAPYEPGPAAKAALGRHR